MKAEPMTDAEWIEALRALDAEWRARHKKGGAT